MSLQFRLTLFEKYLVGDDKCLVDEHSNSIFHFLHVELQFRDASLNTFSQEGFISMCRIGGSIPTSDGDSLFYPCSRGWEAFVPYAVGRYKSPPIMLPNDYYVTKVLRVPTPFYKIIGCLPALYVIFKNKLETHRKQ